MGKGVERMKISEMIDRVQAAVDMTDQDMERLRDFYLDSLRQDREKLEASREAFKEAVVWQMVDNEIHFMSADERQKSVEAIAFHAKVIRELG